MFKNPLKYQQGGSTQDAMQQLVAWLVQNTGLDESQISQRLSQILSDDTAKQELVNNLQSMQEGDQNAAERIKNMFVPQSAKLGGKIQDFICKHGKGGKAGCGCKENGGEVEKAETGMSKLEALKKAKETHGYNNSQARFAYANAKNALRGQGLRGRELRQSAREMISRGTREPIAAIDPTSRLQGLAVPTQPNGRPLPEQTIVGSLTPRMTNNYDSLSFSNAFRAARNKAGGDNGIFNWRGGKYTTALDMNNTTNNTSNNIANNTANNVYNIPELEPVVINNPEIEIPEYEPLQIDAVSVPSVSEILYPGLRDIIEGRSISINSSWPVSQWMQRQQEDSKNIVFGPYGIRNKQPRVLTVTSPSLYTPSPMAFENGGNLKKKENANVEMHQQKNKGRGKLSTPVSTTPKDSSKIEYNPSMQSLSFEDENGNNVTWTRNNFWGKPDGTYKWRSGRDMMFFNPNQNEGFIPYNRFKQWGTNIEGSTYLSPEDDARLKNLYEYARNKKTYIEPHYPWDSSIAKRFWYWLKSLHRDKELTPNAPTFWEQTFKNGGKIK